MSGRDPIGGLPDHRLDNDSESMRVLEAAAQPAQVLFLDLESPLPQLRCDDHYQEACIIFRRSGTPIFMTHLDLRGTNEFIATQLQSLAGLANETRRRDEADSHVEDAKLPRISVVVPTIAARFNDLDRCLDQIEQVDYPNFEILLVDNRREVPSPDPLQSLLSSHPRVVVIREQRPGISAARNAGVSHATGAIVAFTDDDVQVDRNWLRAIGTRFVLQPSLSAVTGLIVPAELETPSQIWFERYYGGFGGPRTFEPLTLTDDLSRPRILRGFRLIVRNAAQAPIQRIGVSQVGAFGAGANMAFRLSAIRDVGGFDTSLGTGTAAYGGEDLAALIRILWSGGELGYEPSAVVLHRHRSNYDDLIKQMEGYGAGFTAMLSSLIWSEPWRLLGLASQLPGLLRRTTPQIVHKLRGLSSSDSEQQVIVRAYPPEMAKREFRGYLRGPLAYLISRRRNLA